MYLRGWAMQFMADGSYVIGARQIKAQSSKLKAQGSKFKVQSSRPRQWVLGNYEG